MNLIAVGMLWEGFQQWCVDGNWMRCFALQAKSTTLATGAAGMVIIGSTGHSFVKLHDESTQFKYKKHQLKSVWSKIVTGFTTHTFIDSGTKVRTDFWDANQHILHSFTVSVQ